MAIHREPVSEQDTSPARILGHTMDCRVAHSVLLAMTEYVFLHAVKIFNYQNYQIL